MTINEKTEDEYETQFDELNNIFPNANFTISMDIEELDEVVTDKKFIVVKQNYNCYCYEVLTNSYQLQKSTKMLYLY